MADGRWLAYGVRRWRETKEVCRRFGRRCRWWNGGALFAQMIGDRPATISATWRKLMEEGDWVHGQRKTAAGRVLDDCVQ